MLVPMTRWHPVEPVDEGFFTSAPHLFRYSTRFEAPPATVWESLTSDGSLADWSATVTSVNWLSPRPFGVGTTREVALAPGAVKVRERYFRWDEGHRDEGHRDEGHRNSFAVYEASLPIFRHFAEDYVVEPEGTDGETTRFTWTVAIEPKAGFALPFKPLAPVLKLAFGRLAVDGRRYFART